MRSLIAASLFLSADAVSTEEHSLMQGLVARRGQLTPEASTKEARMDNTAKLMETATKMMKNGATPDVITFIESTITEVNQNVLSAIVDEHNEDQNMIYELLARFEAAVQKMEECAASVQQQHTDMQGANREHQYCRSDESIKCARSRKCEEELEELWRIVKHEERIMREFHDLIHYEWCPEEGAPPQPYLDDPFRWTPVVAKEGPETSLSEDPYPEIDNEHTVAFREFSVLHFNYYIEQEYKVQLAWHNYNVKIVECAALEEDWTLKTEDCDYLQTTFHDQACAHHNTNRECASDFGREYHLTMIAYNNAVTDIRQKEFDRKREWETLHIVTCLLETVYTHVIHSIDSGEPCPTTESHPEQTAAEINTCHIVEESMTANLTIDYGTPPCTSHPERCQLPPVVEPPCTEEFIHQTSMFAADIQLIHGDTIVAEGLEAYFAGVSQFGWAGCAAPIACSPCEAEELEVDPSEHGYQTCMAHHDHLFAGQMDRDTFKCLNGEECIRTPGRCNGVQQCSDGSDELGCDTAWGMPAVLGTHYCQESSFTCGDGSCVEKAAKCNGIQNCADNSDETECEPAATIEAMTGFTATWETAESEVFTDRQYTFTHLGDFGHQHFIKMHNEDKHIKKSHVQMTLRLEVPGIIYVAKLESQPLPWLQADGWTLTRLACPTWVGNHATMHEDWFVNALGEDLVENVYGGAACSVWEKTFPAGTVQMKGNGGGDGSYLVFATPIPNLVPAGGLPGHEEYIGCFVDDPARDLGAMVGVHTNMETNTFEKCRERCGDSTYMSLQWGGECFCANSYGNGAQYVQRPDSECNVVREPCSPNSHNCGGNWRNAIYRISYTMVDGCLNQNHEVPRAVVSTDSGATASVRCCSMDGNSCDTEDSHGNCNADKTYDEATAICAADGKRLCTETEIISRVCCGTGCGFDGHQVWVSH